MPRREQDEQDDAVGFALEVWHRRKWIALAVFSIVFAAGAALVFSLPPLYRSSATVLVERQQVSEAFVRPSVTTELETRIQTIHKQVTSRARLSEVIARFDLYPELREHVPMEAVVERMRKDLDFGSSSVQPMSGRAATIAFTLAYIGRDPDVVADVTNMLVASYVDENTRTRERQAARTAQFLKIQLDEAKRELDAHQQRERDFTMRHTSELPQQVEVNLSALDRLNTQLRLNGEYQLRAMERRERLEHELAQIDTDGDAAPPPAPDSVETQLKNLEQKLTELRSKFSDRYPEVIRTKAEIAALEGRRSLEGSPTGGNGTNGHGKPSADANKRFTEQAIAQVDNELASLKQEEALLRRLIGSYEARVEIAPKRQEELQRLSRDYETSKERYETLLKRYEEAKVAESLEQSQNVEQFRILDAAVPATGPSAPNTLWLLAISLMGSVVLAIASVVAAERIDTSLHSVDDLRAFAALPVLAVIRQIPTRSTRRRRRLRFALAALAVLAAIVLAVGAARYVGADNEQLTRLTARTRG